ncbi:MAG TPA: hypothetical protein VE825_05410 [Terriglobales bacterium]|jgi:hypothetical protein|nr:hypothetical protein [Terriglobales bacterium]
MRVTRIILGLIGSFFCLTLLLPAIRRLEEWWQIRSGQVFYIEGGYLQEGAQWLIWALVALVPILYAALRPRSSPGWLIMGFSVALVGMAALPSSYGSFLSLRRGQLSERLIDAGSLLEQWGKGHGRFPASQTELEDALRSLQQPSPFARAGRMLPFRPVYVGTRDAAQAASRPGDEPGMLLYTTRPGQVECWLTAEGLGEKSLATQPEILEGPEGGPWVVDVKMPEPPPQAAPPHPAPGKREHRGGA